MIEETNLIDAEISKDVEKLDDQINTQEETEEINEEKLEEFKEDYSEKKNEDSAVEGEEEEDADEDSDSEDDDFTITIKDLSTAVPATTFPYQPVNLNINKRGPSFGPGGQVTNINLVSNKLKTSGLDIEAPGQYNGQSIFDLNLDSLEEKPWRKPGADITDYFNYGFTEETWKIYCDRQKRIRNEVLNETNERPIPTATNINQNGNNIVLRTFTNHSHHTNINNISINNNNTQNSTNLQQIKTDNNQIPSVNENSKYGGSGMQKKAGPPPGRKTCGAIEVIGSGAQAVPSSVASTTNARRVPDIKENFIQVIGQRPPLQGMVPNVGVPSPFSIPPNYNLSTPGIDYSQMPSLNTIGSNIMNQMNYSGQNDFLNQQVNNQRFPMNNQIDVINQNFEEDQKISFREDQEDRRNEFSHNRSNSSNSNRNYSNRENNREDDYRRSSNSSYNRDQYDSSRERLSRDKDHESTNSSRRRDRERSDRNRDRDRNDRDRDRDRERDRDRDRDRDRERDRDRDKDKEKDREHRERDSRRHRDHDDSSRHKSHKRSKTKEEDDDKK